MNIKDFEYNPSEWLFEKIEKRLAARRLVRKVVMVAGIVVVLGGLICAIIFSKDKEPAETVLTKAEPVLLQNSTGEEGQSEKKQDVAMVHRTAQRAVVDEDKKVAYSAQTLAKKEVEDGRSGEKEVFVASQIAVTPSVEALKKQDKEEAGEIVQEEISILPIDIANKNADEELKSEPDTTQVRRDFGTIVWVPNAISINDENEKNRVFGVKFTEQVLDFKVMIFNRAGRLVFESKDPNFAWNATNNGQTVGQGTYVWTMSFKDNSGMQYAERGTVTVIR